MPNAPANKAIDNADMESATASVLLVEECLSRHSPLKQALIDFDYRICKHIDCQSPLLEQIEQYAPDILLIKVVEPSTKLLTALAEINLVAPLPVVILAEQDSDSSIHSAIKTGVSAYVVNEIQPQRLPSIIKVAIERFKEFQSLRNELEQTKAQLESRKLVERAKGLIMEQKGLCEPEAYKLLRKMAMDNSQSLAIVAKNVIDVCQLLGPE